MKLYSIKKFSELSKLPVRTLHYYDEIGLLKPEYKSKSNGYRYYSESQILLINSILHYRELGFKLKEIRELVYSNTYSNNRSLLSFKLEELTSEIEYKKMLISKIQNYLNKNEDSIKVNNFKSKNIVYYRSVDVEGEDSIKKRYLKLTELIYEFKLTPIGLTSLINHDDYREYNEKSVDIEVYIPIAENIHIDFVTRKLNSYSAVTCIHRGSYKNIPSSYAKILDWMQEYNYKYMGTTIEEYLIDWTNTRDESDFVTELQIII